MVYAIYAGAGLAVAGAFIALLGVWGTLSPGVRTGLAFLATGILVIVIAMAVLAIRLIRGITSLGSEIASSTERVAFAQARVEAAEIPRAIWRDAVQEASASFVTRLRDEAERRLTPGAQLSWITEAGWVEATVADFALSVAASAAAGGAVYCNDRKKVVPLDTFLQPDGPTYRRCRGHSPPHCYDTNDEIIACP